MKIGKTYVTDLRDFLLGNTVVFAPRYDKKSMYSNLRQQLQTMFNNEKLWFMSGETPRTYGEYECECAKNLLSRDVFNDATTLEEQTYENGKTLYWVMEDGFLPGALKLYELDVKGALEPLCDIFDSHVNGRAPDQYNVTVHVIKDAPDSANFSKKPDGVNFITMTFGEYLKFLPFGNPRFWRIDNEMQSSGFTLSENVMRLSYRDDMPVIYDNGIFKQYEKILALPNDPRSRQLAHDALESLKLAKLKFNILQYD